MLGALNLVRGAVATKDFVPVLTHFHIYNNRVQGSNGKITLDAPCPHVDGIDVTVPAERFLKAVDACSGEPNFSITDAGKLAVKAASFKAYLPLADNEAYPIQDFGGTKAEIFPVLEALKALEPFVGGDASRPWACGVLLKDGYAYATNNITLVRKPITWTGDPVNIPGYAVAELLRIGIEPTEMLFNENSVVFNLDGAVWMRATLLASEWPDVSKFFTDRDFDSLPEIPEGLLDAVLTITPLCQDPKFQKIYLGEEGVSTEPGETQAFIHGFDLQESIFTATALRLVLEESIGLDLSEYPLPCPFKKVTGVEGVMIGIKK